MASSKPDAKTIKRYCWEHLDALEGYLGRINDAIFSYGELGMQEVRTAALLCQELERHGFRVERELVGMPSAFCARFGEGRPTLAMTSEYDATPGTSQRPGVPEPSPIVAGAPGHAEGHNNNGAALLGTAIVLAEALQHFKLGGRILAIGAPAEEQLVSRPFLVRAGLFKGVDAALHGHVWHKLEVSYGLRQYGVVSALFHFKGRASHSSVDPWLGISALDAMQLMNVGWEMLREHLPLEHRSHHVTVSGGDQPNVVPAEATTWYFFRQRDGKGVRALLDRARKVAQGACLMTGASVKEEIISAAWPTRDNRRLAELAHGNMREVGVPRWTEEEEELARQVQRSAHLPVLGLTHEVSPLYQSQQETSASDLGDVTWVVPHVRIFFPTQPLGVSFHHWSGGVTIATSIARRGLVAGAKAMAGTLVDLIASPRTLAEVRKNFQDEIGGVKYKSLIPKSVEPPYHLNRQIMERYRPQMEPLYYDPHQPEDYLTFIGRRLKGQG